MWLQQTFKKKVSFYQIMLVLPKTLITGARAQGLKPKSMSTEIDSQKKSFAIINLQLWLRRVWFVESCWVWFVESCCWVMRIVTLAIGLLMEIMNCLWRWWGGAGVAGVIDHYHQWCLNHYLYHDCYLCLPLTSTQKIKNPYQQSNHCCHDPDDHYPTTSNTTITTIITATTTKY